MTVPGDRFRLPDTFSSTGDPVGSNPFPVGNPLHGRWNEATRTAEEEVSRIISSAMSSLTPDNVQFRNLDVAKFDAWAKRGIQVVWSDGLMRDYDRWLLSYANACIEEVLRFYQRVPPPFPIDEDLLELRNRLGARVQYWKAEARRFRAEQVAAVERDLVAGQSADDADVGESDRTDEVSEAHALALRGQESVLPSQVSIDPTAAFSGCKTDDGEARGQGNTTARASVGNVFCPVGGMWEVAFGGVGPLVMRDVRGMKIVHRLLQAPNQPLTAASLFGRERIDCPEPASLTRGVLPAESTPASMGGHDARRGIVAQHGDEVIDRKARVACKARLEQISEELVAARSKGDIPAIEELQAEKQKIEDYLRQNQFKGRGRRTGSEIDQNRSAASKAYGRALEHLAKAGFANLVTHLKGSIRSGNSFRYAPEPHVTWRT